MEGRKAYAEVRLTKYYEVREACAQSIDAYIPMMRENVLPSFVFCVW